MLISHCDATSGTSQMVMVQLDAILENTKDKRTADTQQVKV